MLFSNAKIARFINRNFESTWQSLRPVPIVKVDFGNGTVVKRTLHGNIATHLVSADGQVLDVLPGLYEPETYLTQLEQLRRLHLYSQKRMGASLVAYHRSQQSAIEHMGKPAQLLVVSRGASISGRELGVEIVLEPQRRLQSRGRAVRKNYPQPKVTKATTTNADGKQVPHPALLREDTRINETIRRKMIHGYLADHADATPASMTKWLYREVLKADLDDPYLGLGPLLGQGS